MPRTYKHIEVHPSGRLDPDKTILECEASGCTNDVLVGTSYSFIVSFATTGPHPIAGFGCEEEQHFCCSPACARAAALVCIDEHLTPAHRALEDAQIAAKAAKEGTAEAHGDDSDPTGAPGGAGEADGSAGIPVE